MAAEAVQTYDVKDFPPVLKVKKFRAKLAVTYTLAAIAPLAYVLWWWGDPAEATARAWYAVPIAAGVTLFFLWMVRLHFSDRNWYREAWLELHYFYARSGTPLPQICREAVLERIAHAEAQASQAVGDPAVDVGDSKAWLKSSRTWNETAGELRVLLALEDELAAQLKDVAGRLFNRAALRKEFGEGIFDLKVRKLHGYARAQGFMQAQGTEDKAAA